VEFYSEKNSKHNICKEKIFKTFLVANFVYALQKTQSVGIHDVLNVQGFAMHYGVISNMSIHLQVSRCEEILYSKAKGQTAFFSYVECYRSKDLSLCISGRT